MPRPAAGALTGAGFAQSGTSTLYTKTTGTALARVDLGSGECSVSPAAPGTQMATADLNSHLAAFSALGVFAGVPGRDVPATTAGGTIFYGLSVS